MIVQTQVPYLLLLVATKVKKKKVSKIKRNVIKQYFEEKLDTPYTCAISGKTPANRTNIKKQENPKIVRPL